MRAELYEISLCLLTAYHGMEKRNTFVERVDRSGTEIQICIFWKRSTKER